MISFYPGPSRVYDEVPSYVKQAQVQGILSMNHRSPEFVRMSEQTVALLESRLGIPKKFKVFFLSSATECWEVIAQSVVADKSIHIYNGAFGKKWFETTKALLKQVQAVSFNREAELDLKQLVFMEGDTICITQNETSNGTQVNNFVIKSIKRNNPSHIIAIDATSSMAGVRLDFNAGDIWFASVQKCFGLPAGLAMMIVSPKGLARIHQLNESNHYNSLTRIDRMMEVWQTTHTPNVLGIFLLMKVLESMNDIKVIDERTTRRFLEWQAFFAGSQRLKFLIANKNVQSKTVVAIQAPEQQVKKVKREAKKAGFVLGEGYAELSSTTFRIANFSAIKEKEIKALRKFLTNYL